MKDGNMSFNYLRMDPENFDELFQVVGPFVQKKATNFRDYIPPGMKLVVDLATGESQSSLSFNFRLGRSTICSILGEVPKVI